MFTKTPFLAQIKLDEVISDHLLNPCKHNVVKWPRTPQDF